MKKLIILLLIGSFLTMTSMEDPQQKGHELIERIAGSVAPSSSIPQVKSGGKTSSSDASSGSSDRAQFNDDHEERSMTPSQRRHAIIAQLENPSKQEKRRSLVPVVTDGHQEDDEALAQRVAMILQVREQKKKEQSGVVTRNQLLATDKKEKRKSVNLWLHKKNPIPQLSLDAMEKGTKDSSITDEELERMISFIAQATGNDITDIKERLKERFKELHNTPPASPLYSENISALDAIDTVRKLTNDHISTTRVVDTLRKREHPVHALSPKEVVANEGFEAGLNELLKLANAEFAVKLKQTGSSRNIYRILSAAGAVATVGFSAYEIWAKSHGGSSSDATSAPVNTTLP